jgi:hypothetical protein
MTHSPVLPVALTYRKERQMTDAFLIAYGCPINTDFVVGRGLEEWVSAFCERYPALPLAYGEDHLAIALASTDEEQAAMLGISKLPDEGVLSLYNATEWVSSEQMRLVEHQWALVQREAGSSGLSIPAGQLMFLVAADEPEIGEDEA